MKSKLTFMCILFLITSLKAQNDVAVDVFLDTQEKLKNIYSLEYQVETRYQYLGEDKILYTEFKQQKLSYDPYTGYSFYKKIGEDVKIYYHFLELGMIEENKGMLSVFNHAEDPAFPTYLSSYSDDLDNLWWIATIMENNRTTFSYEASENINGRKYYKYRVWNYLLWLDSSTKLPYRIESLSRNGRVIQRMYKNIRINNKIEESDFIYPRNKEYILVRRHSNPESLKGSHGVPWSLKDVSGKTVSLSDYKGKPLLIGAWSSDCDHCLTSFSIIKNIQRIYGELINIVTLSMDYDLVKTRRTIQYFKLPFTVLQGDAIFQRDYLLHSFPSYYVLDKEGIIMLQESSANRGQLEENLYQTLNEVTKR